MLLRGSVSRNFILGLADVQDSGALTEALAELRETLLANPYFRGVPSMLPSGRKMALQFHAKDDLAEVRREVFGLLMMHEIKFSAVVMRMQSVLEYVRRQNRHYPSYRYHPNELYDHAAKRLFKQRLHKDDRYLIHFASRGKRDRTRTLAEALEAARARFCEEQGITTASAIAVKCVNAHDEGGCQAADYFLWALQRLYARGEDRYLRLLWPMVSLVHDVDDTREKAYGVYYKQNRPLTADALDGIEL